jgi:hypothetical protein
MHLFEYHSIPNFLQFQLFNKTSILSNSFIPITTKQLQRSLNMMHYQFLNNLFTLFCSLVLLWTSKIHSFVFLICTYFLSFKFDIFCLFNQHILALFKCFIHRYHSHSWAPGFQQHPFSIFSHLDLHKPILLLVEVFASILRQSRTVAWNYWSNEIYCFWKVIE